MVELMYINTERDDHAVITITNLDIVSSLEVGQFEQSSGSVWQMHDHQSIGHLPVLIYNQQVCVTSLYALWNYLLHIDTSSKSHVRVRNKFGQFSQ